MIEQLPGIPEDNWLSRIDPATFHEASFPLHDVIRDSLYYPSSGFDGDPIRHLGGNVISFIYVDYGKGRDDLHTVLSNSGFRGYKIIASRDVSALELAPNGWTPSPPTHADGDPYRYRDWMKTPFCSWMIFQRLDEVSANHGPHRFSLLYLCADGVAAFQALYVANRASPSIVAIIQPGHAFGGNWAAYPDPQQIFARSVLQNSAGKPAILLYGGIGRRNLYRQPCWPDYSELVCFLDKAGGGSIGVWRRTQQQHSTDGAAHYR